MNTPRLLLSPALAFLLASLVSSLALPVAAQNLSQLYEAALGFDAGILSAKLLYQANVAKADQARAAIFPTVGLNMAVNRSDVTSPTASFDRGTFGNQSATIAASQPLDRPANRLIAQQGTLAADLAQAQLASAGQDLIVRVAQAYFDVLAASDSLTLVRAQKAAVALQQASAERNFEVGTATITDTRDAQARLDLVLAQEIAADNDLRVKQLVLDQLTGQSGAAPKPLRSPITLLSVAPDDVSVWVSQAVDTHPVIVQARLGLEVAQLEARKATAGHHPTLDLNGSYTVLQNDGSASVAQDYRTNVASIGLSLNLPLFAGYAIQNRAKETVALLDKASTDLDAAKRTVTQATRTAFFGVQSGLGQVKALEAAEASSQVALDATRLGYQVGVRINIDVLNAQSLLYDTKTRLAKARYDVLLGGLKLRQANGSLQASDLSAINGLLAP